MGFGVERLRFWQLEGLTWKSNKFSKLLFFYVLTSTNFRFNISICIYLVIYIHMYLSILRKCFQQFYWRPYRPIILVKVFTSFYHCSDEPNETEEQEEVAGLWEPDQIMLQQISRWWFHFFNFHPYLGKMNPIWLICFNGFETLKMMVSKRNLLFQRSIFLEQIMLQQIWNIVVSWLVNLPPCKVIRPYWGNNYTDYT